MQRHILITTGSLGNLGVQSMVYLTVSILKKHMPDREIAILLQYPQAAELNDANKYNFKVLPWTKPLREKLLYPNLPLNGFKNIPFEAYLPEIRGILENADFALDLSGFSLSSQWNFSISLNYIYNLIIFKKFGIRTYLLPQSFGPFHYKLHHKAVLYPLLRKYLQYPEKIFPREEDGLRHILKFTKNNVFKATDLVLQIDKPVAEHIFKNPLSVQNFDPNPLEIPAGSVAVIPNIKVIEANSDVFEYYQRLINFLLEKGKLVHIIAHSTADRQAAQELMSMFSGESRVQMLDHNYNCIQIIELLKQFDLVISARFHAIVHSYKAGVPVLAFGWSAKYRELMDMLEQSDYLFDVRESLDFGRIKQALDYLLLNHSSEAEKIRHKLQIIQSGGNLIEDIARKNAF